ncbi:MAG: M48 family metalloprotease [Phycisphaerae bacterium]
MTTTLDSAAPALSGQPALAALRQPVRRPRTRPLYLFLAGAVATAMVLLPLLYLAMILAAAWGEAWYAVHAPAWFEDLHSARAMLLVYVGPLVVGGILIVFMIKPIFARRKVLYAPQALSRRDEPFLFAFVDALCEALGAPKPHAIHIDMELNASAGFEGAFAGIFGRRLVLTFGLPLVSGMSLNQFTAVLAHEFGHFRQRGATRLNYLIRSISLWFARVVYQRDAWDASLEQAARSGGHWAIQIIAMVAKLGVWMSRRILWVLMMIGHLFSSLLMRQQEYDADRHAACIVGSAAAEEALRALPLLGAAMQATYEELRQNLAEKRLPDNVPQLIASRARTLPDAARTALWTRVREHRATWFDTHPHPLKRYAAVEKLRDSGIFNVPGPASGLLQNFQSLSRLMTKEFYRASIGRRVEEVEVVESKAVEARREEHQQKAASLSTWLGDLVHPLRPAFLPEDPIEEDRPAVLHQWRMLRKQFKESLPAAKESIAAWERGDADLIALEQAVAVANSGAHAASIDARFAGPALVAAQRKAIEGARTTARAAIDSVLAPALRVVQLALHVGRPAPAPRADSGSYDLAESVSVGPMDRHVAALLPMRATAPLFDELRRLFEQQAALLRLLDANRQNSHFIGGVISLSRKQTTLIERLRGAMKDTAYPFAEPSRPMTLAAVMFILPTQPNDVGKTMAAADHALAQYQAIYMRIMAELATYARDMEQQLFPPRPRPM